MDVLEDVESERDVERVVELHVDQLAETDAVADRSRCTIAGEAADVDAADVDAGGIEAREHTATGAADLQRRRRLQQAHDLGHHALVRVDRQHPHTRLLVEAVLEDRRLDPVEGGRIVGDERADPLPVVIDEVGVAVGHGREHVGQADGALLDAHAVLVGGLEVGDDLGLGRTVAHALQVMRATGRIHRPAEHLEIRRFEETLVLRVGGPYEHGREAARPTRPRCAGGSSRNHRAMLTGAFQIPAHGTGRLIMAPSLRAEWPSASGPPLRPHGRQGRTTMSTAWRPSTRPGMLPWNGASPNV